MDKGRIPRFGRNDESAGDIPDKKIDLLLKGKALSNTIDLVA